MSTVGRCADADDVRRHLLGRHVRRHRRPDHGDDAPGAQVGRTAAARGPSVDLTPRSAAEDASPRSRRKRPWAAVAVLGVVLITGGFAVTKFLSSAIDYYCNVDEIGHKSGCTVGRDLRIQSTVDEG